MRGLVSSVIRTKLAQRALDFGLRKNLNPPGYTETAKTSPFPNALTEPAGRLMTPCHYLAAPCNFSAVLNAPKPSIPNRSGIMVPKSN